MRVSSKGQVTIPGRLRRRNRMSPGTRVEVVEKSGDIVLMHTGRLRSRPSDEEFAAYLARVTGILDVGTSTDEFMRRLRGE